MSGHDFWADWTEEDDILFGTPEIKHKMINSLPHSAGAYPGYEPGRLYSSPARHMLSGGGAGFHRIIDMDGEIVIYSCGEMIRLPKGDKCLVTFGKSSMTNKPSRAQRWISWIQQMLTWTVSEGN
jgi:hypothetical protein